MNKTDNQNQVIKLCGICGYKWVYNEYHRLYNPCKTCVAKVSTRYYQANRNKKVARSKLYQENTKIVRKPHTQQVEELNKKVEEIPRAMETFFFGKN